MSWLSNPVVPCQVVIPLEQISLFFVRNKLRFRQHCCECMYENLSPNKLIVLTNSKTLILRGGVCRIDPNLGKNNSL